MAESGPTPQMWAHAAVNFASSIGAAGVAGSAGQAASGFLSWCAGFGSCAGSRASHGRAFAVPAAASNATSVIHRGVQTRVVTGRITSPETIYRLGRKGGPQFVKKLSGPP